MQVKPIEQRPKLLLKISPDLSDKELKDIANVILNKIFNNYYFSYVWMQKTALMV